MNSEHFHRTHPISPRFCSRADRKVSTTVRHTLPSMFDMRVSLPVSSFSYFFLLPFPLAPVISTVYNTCVRGYATVSFTRDSRMLLRSLPKPCRMPGPSGQVTVESELQLGPLVSPFRLNIAEFPGVSILLFASKLRRNYFTKIYIYISHICALIRKYTSINS